MTAIRGRVASESEADPAAIFEAITDIAGLPSWNAVMTRVCEQPAHLEAGGQWVVEFHVLGRIWRSRSLCEVIDRVERRFAYRTQTDDGNPSFAEWEWRVIPTSAGSQVQVRWELHPATFWRRLLLARVRNWQLARREVPASLAALERVVATEGSAS